MITKIFPYLNFDGQGQQAAHFYTDVLNAELSGMVTYGEAHGSDMDMGDLPEEAKDMVMNAEIILKNGQSFMISDVPPGMGMPSLQSGNNISLTITTGDIEEARTLFGKLAEGGEIAMELQETFWSPLYGSVTDRFGIEWQISVEPETEK
ncbi:MAG TPA: VOC family protein [Planococcus sp. (in: firmicutes)]|nr:VOC family protein [Planococcus sp. (in: firmicutes)]